MSDDAFRLTALDARRYDFGNALRGYDRTRVDQFRDQVAEELERLSRANQELEVKARNFHEQLRAFRERDKALNDALISAQQLRGEIREQAEREAALIIREAQGEAERSLEVLRADIRRAEDELQQLWRNRRSYLAQLRSVMEREMADLDNADSAPPPTGVMARATDYAPAGRREPVRDAVRESPRELLREAGPDEHSRDRDASRPVSLAMPRDIGNTVPRAAAAQPLREATMDAPRAAPREPNAGARNERPTLEPAAGEPETIRDIPSELLREFTNDMPHGFREPARENSRDAVTDPVRAQFRQPWASAARDTTASSPRETPQDALSEPGRAGLSRKPEVPPEPDAHRLPFDTDDNEPRGNDSADQRDNHRGSARFNSGGSERLDESLDERTRNYNEERLHERATQRLRETPAPRPSLPTPSWLDVVEGE